MSYKSDSKLDLTPAQRLSDEEFLKSISEEFVKPLFEEFCDSIDGFAEMDEQEKIYHAFDINVPMFEAGDSLPFAGGLAYAGVWLGGYEIVAQSRDTAIQQYKPPFSDTIHFDSETWEARSETEIFLHESRDIYESLPPTFKAALLCRYIDSKVICGPLRIKSGKMPGSNQTLSFVLGEYLDEGGIPETYRFDASPCAGNTKIYSGWNIRIRDAKPVVAFGTELFQTLQDMRLRMDMRLDEESQRWVNVRNDSLFEGEGKERRPRTPKEGKELACQYIWELEQKGLIIDKRMGGIGFDQLLVDLQRKFGDKIPKYKNGDSLGRTYRKWKKENG